MRNVFSLLAVMVFISGCASNKSNLAHLITVQGQLNKVLAGSGDDAAAQKRKEVIDKELNELIAGEIEETNRVCSDVIGNRERLAEKRSKDTLRISLLGLAAGSVIAPALTSANAAANAPWISAFSGLGGVSSLAVRQIDGAGYSGAADINVINGISTEVKKQMNIALNATNSGESRYAAVIAARNECLYFPRASFVIVGDSPEK
ncbi:hypothetical protein [Stutzerimonas kirkiae]|uniref:hypothetical protein n=1 Tax=Stutzerimonas kirkiae TaxID=2211392 RepID=UPI00103787EB|nr:hypothetical protein [Stutzerimonas kirkiae]